MLFSTRSASVAMAMTISMACLASLPHFEGRAVADSRSHALITPAEIKWTSDSVAVRGHEILLEPFCGQTTVAAPGTCVLDTRQGRKAAILLDWGRELHGALRITSAIRPSQTPAHVRIRLGESVSEAMSDVNSSSATNDHAMRDFIVEVPWLGRVETGESGFRFACIELLDSDYVLPLRAIEADFIYRDLPWIGSFRCSSPRMDSIWATGAYTVQLNMQDFLWDGIKRDRLVWVGDMHPEVMTVNTVFGDNEVVKKSLDLARDDTPLPGWMNGMCSYSLWWILIQRDLYLYQGDADYLSAQTAYLNRLADQIIGQIKDNRENLTGGVRFLDWPTSENDDVIASGLHALTLMALEAAGEIGRFTGDEDLETKCTVAAKQLRQYTPELTDNKQSASLLALTGVAEKTAAADVVSAKGAEGFSTFFGYYMLEALALAGRYDEALKIISDYWGGMLDLGATTFWEDFNYSDACKATRIDEFVAPGAYDIHADGGAYCYKGLRHSLCHGWASGPTPWLSRHILGIRPVEPGFATVAIEPHLGSLEWAEGTFPTPHGPITVAHRRLPSGEIESKISLPEGVVLKAD